MSTGAPGQNAQRKAVVALGAAAMAAIAGFAAVYVTLGRPDNAVRPAKTTAAQPPAGPQTAPAGPGSNPLSQGQIAAFVFRKAPEALPEVKFQDAAGKERTLADWRGKVVLAQSVGNLVPALPQGDAGARPAAEGIGLGQVRGGRHQRRPQRRGGVQEVSRRDAGRAPRALCRSNSALELRPAGRRLAGDAAARHRRAARSAACSGPRSGTARMPSG